MKLQDQVITIEQAKRLKELRITQDSYFLINPKGEVLESWMLDGNEDAFCSAYTVAELGVMMGDKFLYEGRECFACSEGFAKERPWISGIHTVWAHDKPVVAKKYFPGLTEAQVRGDLLIYLLEKVIVTPEEANTRLLK